MNKKMKELLAAIDAKRKEAAAFLNGEEKDVDAASRALDEIDVLEKEYEVEKRLYEAEKSLVPIDEVPPAGAEKKDNFKDFADAARSRFKATLSEGSNPNGGYTVPEDVVTQVRELREAKASLLTLVKTETVGTDKGARTYKTRSTLTGFAKVNESGAITATATPQFARVAYEIGKYAGYMPVTNELLADSDENIVNTVTSWLADESRVTANKLILAQVATKTAVEFDGIDDIKKALNVTLGQAFKPTSKIVTNDDGLQWLDTLKQEDSGLPLLASSPVDPLQPMLAVGFIKVPVVVIPNADMPTTNGKIPFIVGDLNEGIVYFDRAQISIMSSNVAAIGNLNAYEQDLTIFRAIEREDVKVFDAAAFVNAYIEPVAG